MLGFLFAFFIGSYYYKLAKKFKKNSWIYAAIGIIAYFILSFIIRLLLNYFPFYIFTVNELKMSLSIAVTIGLLIRVILSLIFVIVLYKSLKKIWTKEQKHNNEEELIDDFILKD